MAHLRLTSQVSAPCWELKGKKASGWRFTAYIHHQQSDLEKSDKALRQAGKDNGKEQILALRQQWENLCNLALERQGYDQRISAKSYKERNIDKQPTIHLGPAVTAMERKGIETVNGAYNRAIKKNNLQRFLQAEIAQFEQAISKLKGIMQELRSCFHK